MKLNVAMTLFAITVIFLANCVWAAEYSTPASATNIVNSTVTAVKKSSEPSTGYGISASITRSSNLIDFKDGSRGDAIDYMIIPTLIFSSGRKISAQISATQNLRDEYTNTENGMNDISVSLSLKPTPLALAEGWGSKFSYSLTAVVPVSEYSTKKDQLNTSLSGKVGFSMAQLGQGFSFASSLSIGRNFHSYEEDINGNILNQYSSNQSINIAYENEGWSISTDFINRSRWTYQNSTKSSFEISEEVGYAFNSNISFALGHTNSGATLKPNATDSNIDIYNENSSTVYGTLGLNY